MSSAVNIAVRDGICHIEMARPEKKNALTAAMYQTMADALADAEKNPAIRVILISGSGGSFTAGNDLADFLATPPMDDSAPVFRFIKGFSELTLCVNSFCSGYNATGICTNTKAIYSRQG